MAEIQEKGICADEDYFYDQHKLLEVKIEDIEKNLFASKEAKKFKDHTGKDIDLASGNDLKVLFYEIMNSKKTFTKKGNLTVDKISLEKIDSPFIKQLLYKRKLEKAQGTYFAQFIREIYNGKINPFFDLTIPVSYRSSSQAPNFQNIPTRDDEVKKLIRSGVKASPGRQLLFFDGSGMEVRTSVCYHKDPNMIKYVTDPTTDMHRDTAADIWMLPHDEVTKDIRFYAKNQWVFAQFYGSYYVDCGNTLWETCIDNLNLKTKIGMPLKEHLIAKGIKTNAEFLEHCQNVENIFWKERFKVYDQWKKDINAEYAKNGVIYSLMGFPYQGIMNRKQVSNFPIQGTAFHLLLWTLLELDKVIKKNKWKSWINGQIHDEGILDAIPEEIPYIVEATNYIVGTKMRKTFDWINVPFEMEFAITPINGSWYDKKELK
jgi:DNA polymerase-1